MALLSGQLQDHEERGPISPAIPAASVRTVVVRLSPNGYEGRKIRKLGVEKVVNALKKPLSFVLSSNGVSPINGSNALDLSRILVL